MTARPLKTVPRVPSGDIHRLSPLDVIKAQIAEDGSDDGGVLFRDMGRKISQCAGDEIGRDTKRCPLRRPLYRDLNGDEKDELLVGIEDSNFLIVRAFTIKDEVVTQIMDAFAQPLSVELTGRDVIVREPTTTAGYDLRTVYSWDRRRQAMERRNMEFVPQPSGTPSSSGASPSAAPRKGPPDEDPAARHL
ncbi:hypothetical protein [Streptomyces sp. NPDC017529]|uniref:hypothetical protein n=1 Tax=Streptomyces sp. NPDC017529 TaxID=3365000 RepID=UPI0037BB4566